MDGCMQGQMMFMAEWNVIMFLCSPSMANLDAMTEAGLFINDLSMHDFSRDLLLARLKPQGLKCPNWASEKETFFFSALTSQTPCLRPWRWKRRRPRRWRTQSKGLTRRWRGVTTFWLRWSRLRSQKKSSLDSIQLTLARWAIPSSQDHNQQKYFKTAAGIRVCYYHIQRHSCLYRHLEKVWWYEDCQCP